MQHPFFKETAEEMVNRLFGEWLKKNTFVHNLPLADPVMKNCIIRSLEIIDEAAVKVIVKNHDSNNLDFMEKVELNRENHVILEIAKIFAKLWIANLAPPPLDQPVIQNNKPHLRLVVNNR